MSYPVGKYQIESATRRGLQAGVWQNALDSYAPGRPDLGTFFYDDFVGSPGVAAVGTDGQWFVDDMTAGGTSEALAPTDGYGGLVTLSAATGTAHFGVEARPAGAATGGAFIELPTSSTDAKGVCCFDIRLTIDLSELVFVGLTESIAQFYGATSAKPADSDYIGFEKTAAGDLNFVCANDNAGGTAVTDSATVIAAADLTDGATYRLGFRVDESNKVTICVNDTVYTAAGDSINSLALPIEALLPRICLGRAAGSDTTVSSVLDYVAAYCGPDANG